MENKHLLVLLLSTGSTFRFFCGAGVGRRCALWGGKEKESEDGGKQDQKPKPVKSNKHTLLFHFFDAVLLFVFVILLGFAISAGTGADTHLEAPSAQNQSPRNTQ